MAFDKIWSIKTKHFHLKQNAKQKMSFHVCQKDSNCPNTYGEYGNTNLSARNEKSLDIIRKCQLFRAIKRIKAL